MPVNLIVFIILSLVVVVSALAMVISKNAVYSALFLVMNLATIAVFYLIMGSPFISLVQITVYAGSIMVMFLFVIMLLGAERINAKENIKGQRVLGILLGLVLFTEAALYVFWKLRVVGTSLSTKVNVVSPYDIGMTLFNDYPLPFLITSIILVVATVGAILFTRGDVENKKDAAKSDTLSGKVE